jgi:hypothetical protein
MSQTIDQEELIKLLQSVKTNENYFLVFKSQHTDEEYDDLETLLQEENVVELLQRLTTDVELYNSETVLNYFELHATEKTDYCNSELLLLLYYMADDNELDTKDLSEELENKCNNTLSTFMNVLEFPDNKYLTGSNNLLDRVELFKQNLKETVPLCCKHMSESADKFEESNLYQQLLSQMLGPNMNKILENLVPHDDEEATDNSDKSANLSQMFGNMSQMFGQTNEIEESSDNINLEQPSNLPDMGQMFANGMPDMSKLFGGSMSDMDQMFANGMPDMSKLFANGMPDMSKLFGGGNMPDMSQMFSGLQQGQDQIYEPDNINQLLNHFMSQEPTTSSKDYMNDLFPEDDSDDSSISESVTNDCPVEQCNINDECNLRS